MNYEERRVKVQVASKHATTDALITSVESKVETVESKVNSINLDTDSVESMLSTVKTQNTAIDSKAVTIKGYTDNVESMLTTVKDYTDAAESKADTAASKATTAATEVDSKHTTTDALITSKAATIVAQGTSADSKLDTVKGYTDTVESQLGTVKTQGTSAGSKLDTIKTYTDDVESKATTAASKATTAATAANAASSKADTIKGYTDSVESQLGTVKTQGTSAGSKLDTIKTYTDDVESVLDTVDSKTDTNLVRNATQISKLDTVINGIGGIQNNMLTKIVAPSEIERPDSGSITVRLWAYNYDSAGSMEAPDSAPTIKIVDSAGNVIVAETAMTSDGRTPDAVFRYDWSVPNTIDLESHYIEVKTIENTVTRYNGHSVVIVDNAGVVGEIASKHATSDALVTSKAATLLTDTNAANSKLTTVKGYTDSLESQVGTVKTQGTTADSKLTTIKGYTDNVESMLLTVESKLDNTGTGDATQSKQNTIISKVNTVKGYTDNVESMLTTVQTYTDEAESKADTAASKATTAASAVASKHATTDALVTSKSATIVTEINVNESKIDTIKGYTDSIESVLGTVGGNVSDTESKVDTLKSASLDVFSQFDEVIFPKTSGSLTADGNDEEEIATTASQETAYGDDAIMASRIIGQGMGTKPVRMCYVDLGWNGQMDANTGNSKFMVVAGSTPAHAGAVDLTNEVSETVTKTGRWRSGQIKLAAMNNLPFTIMLLGKVGNGADTLTCKGFAASSVTVVHELA